MKRVLLYGATLALLGSNTGCEKSDAPSSPLTCSFQLLNEQGQEATVFSQGQNIVFRFQITNSTDQDIALANPPINTQEFLEVKQLTASGGKQSVGKPYAWVFCTFQGAVLIPAHQTLTLSIPWVEAPAFPMSAYFCGHAATTYLAKGQYRTSFTTPLTILHADQPEEVTKPQTFTKEFTVR
ncbi:hypothetical protein [Hymenobacter wooponensis]|uniref:Intracellular proteinase inhibitor BsuPI domain-containing protein n=1 Tax=Hymenobacter wooponensis TaxID=1525360 RepID=A0A4Z0MJZ0_9BACT|nr:hypothetical protein [Hymenobacter wooponensis]TGD79505.1 hypothetical protein EU557_14860 [Hymenobacter wooponensis]